MHFTGCPVCSRIWIHYNQRLERQKSQRCNQLNISGCLSCYNHARDLTVAGVTLRHGVTMTRSCLIQISLIVDSFDESNRAILRLASRWIFTGVKVKSSYLLLASAGVVDMSNTQKSSHHRIIFKASIPASGLPQRRRTQGFQVVALSY